MRKEDFAKFLLRIGIAFSFIYAAIGASFNPEDWIGFVPLFVDIFISRESFLIVHVIFNLVLGLWLLIGWKKFYAALVASIALFSIVIFNLNSLDIVFRDISILLAAVALAVLSYWD